MHAAVDLVVLGLCRTGLLGTHLVLNCLQLRIACERSRSPCGSHPLQRPEFEFACS